MLFLCVCRCRLGLPLAWMGGMELGHLTGQDLPDSQTAGAKQSTTLLSVYVFSLQASAFSGVWTLHFVNISIPFSLLLQLYRMALTLLSPLYGRVLGLCWEASLPETHWRTGSETRGGHHGLTASICTRFTFLLRRGRKGSTSSLMTVPAHHTLQWVMKLRGSLKLEKFHYKIALKPKKIK